MKAPAHITAGIVFTGSLCSLYDINVFQSYTYTGLCVIFSILPDIDTPKSIIGKFVYPIAYWLNRKYGHRTITHSLLFLLGILGLFKLLIFFSLIETPDYMMIAVFAILSHIILDMFTVSGVPFFYPFLRNSCVIPANPNYRFNTNDLKSELIVSATCCALIFTMQPLFSHGFWTAYNRQFGTIKHVHRENNNTEFYTLCDYSYIDNTQHLTGTAIVIESQQNEITLFDKDRIIILNADDPQLKVIHTKPRPSTIPKKYEYIQFYGITLDSIQNMLNQHLCTGLIQSNYNIQYIDKAILYHTNFINIKNKYDFHIQAATDTSNLKLANELAELEAAQAEERRKYNNEMKKYNNHITQLQYLETRLKEKSLTNYERNKLQDELIHLRQRPIEKPIFEPNLRTQVKKEEIRRSATERHLQFSGYLTIYQVINPSNPEVREQYPDIDPESYIAKTSSKPSSIYKTN